MSPRRVDGERGAGTRRPPSRRDCLAAALATLASPAHALAAGPAAAAAEAEAESAIRAGGVVVVMRHALAPGVYDPPQFRLGDCRTQRNLSDEGRAQAQRIGAWFKARSLLPARVRSSPWCRCIDTATLAFGAAEPWPVPGSPRGADGSGSDAAGNAAALQTLQQALLAASARRGQFEVWVTHMFVQSRLVDSTAESGEGLVLRAEPADGRARLLARLPAS